MRPEQKDKITQLANELGLDEETVEKMTGQDGEILSPLVERFLILENWRVEDAPPEYEEQAYEPDAPYLALLIRDLAVEIIKIKKKLGMIK